MGWTNWRILGDALLVMNSLLVKKDMAGTVQMMDIDPHRGIRYSSNFQLRIDRQKAKNSPR